MPTPTELSMSRTPATPDTTSVYDAKAGIYRDAIVGIPTADKLPTQQLPMAPMGTPFVVKGG